MQQTKIVVASCIATLALCAMLALMAEATDKRIINREACTAEKRGVLLSCNDCCNVRVPISKGQVKDSQCVCTRDIDNFKFAGDIMVERDGILGKWEEISKPLKEEKVKAFYEAMKAINMPIFRGSV